MPAPRKTVKKINERQETTTLPADEIRGAGEVFDRDEEEDQQDLQRMIEKELEK